MAALVKDSCFQRTFGAARIERRRRGWIAASYVQNLLDGFYGGTSYRRHQTLGNVTSLGLLIGA